MPSLMFKQQSYGGTSTVNDASHVIADNGSGIDATSQQLFENILGNFATVEASSTASKAYNVGDFLILNSHLYRVTAAIDHGDTIAVGTNVVQTTVGDVCENIILGNFATVEASSTASKAYNVGDFLILNNCLYRVIATIASGGTIAVGTNVVQTTVGGTMVNLQNMLSLGPEVVINGNTAASSNTKMYLRKYGALVHCFINIASEDQTDRRGLFTIPSGYRPAYAQFIPAVSIFMSAAHEGFFKFYGPSESGYGNVDLNYYSASSETAMEKLGLRANVTYITLE